MRKKKNKFDLKEFERKEIIPTCILVIFISSLFSDLIIVNFMINMYDELLSKEVSNTWLLYIIALPFIMLLLSTIVFVIYVLIKDSLKKYIG